MCPCQSAHALTRICIVLVINTGTMFSIAETFFAEQIAIVIRHRWTAINTFIYVN